jgi:hypothetical protein
MADETILKGVFKDGSIVASVIQKGEQARILVKGIEPGSPTFLEDARKVTAGCRPHIESFAERELCLVAVANPAGAEGVAPAEADLAGLGVTRLSVLDGTCGLTIRVVDAEPAPIPLPYSSLRSAGAGLPDQPGMAEIPAALPRRAHKDLGDNEKKIFEAAVQVAGRGLVRVACFDDGGLKLAVTVKDSPPPRARTVLVPLARMADDLAKFLAFEDLVKELGALRT